MFALSKDGFISELWDKLHEAGYQDLTIGAPIGNRYSNQLSHPKLDAIDYDRLAGYSQDGDSECTRLLCIYSTRLVYKIAVKFTTKFDIGWGNVNEDLMQAGFVGLLNSIPRWNPEKGTFRTYSHYFIRLAIIEEVRRIDNFISIKDEDRANLARKLPTLWIQCRNEISSPTKQQFVDWLNTNGHINKNIRNGHITVKDIESMEQFIGVGSLDNVVVYSSDDDEVTLFDVLEDTSTQTPEVMVLEQERKNQLADLWQNIIANLTDKQRLVFTLYNGLESLTSEEEEILGGKRITYKSLAIILAKRYPKYYWSQTSCQDIHTRAMQRARSYVQEQGLTFSEFSEV